MTLLPSLLGPTASGKTTVAIAAARVVSLEVVSADSRQIYRGLTIGTAKPTSEERAAVPHHLVDVADPAEAYSAARYAEEARAAIAAIRSRGHLPFLVGGSGLYLRAVEEGLFEGPARDEALRAELEAFADVEGNDALHARLQRVDPATAARLHPADRVRVVRALEVWELTGVTLSQHHARHAIRAPAERCVRFGLAWPPERLARRIERRIDRMLEAGWLDEVRRLLEGGVDASAPAFDALGYREILAVVEGTLTVSEARERIVAATRRFAKRQRTWFRAVGGVRWFDVAETTDLDSLGRTIGEVIRGELEGEV